MSFETVLFSKGDDGIARVSLNRPKVRNAFSQQMQDELREVWRDIRYDNNVRCVILSAEGDHFCTGIDRAEAMSEENTDAMARGEYPGYPTPWMYDDPGRDIGTHVTHGMTAAFEPMQLLKKMPFQEVMRMMLLGSHERMSAKRAYEIGLVSEVCPRDELTDRVEWAAGVIAGAPALAIQGTMRALWTGLEVSRSQAIELANLYTRIGNDAAAFKEAQTAFESGKRPEWRIR